MAIHCLMDEFLPTFSSTSKSRRTSAKQCDYMDPEAFDGFDTYSDVLHSLQPNMDCHMHVAAIMLCVRMYRTFRHNANSSLLATPVRYNG